MKKLQINLENKRVVNQHYLTAIDNKDPIKRLVKIILEGLSCHQFVFVFFH